MKEQMIDYLEIDDKGYTFHTQKVYPIEAFIDHFSSINQPERLNEKTREGCDSLTSTYI